MYSCCWDCSCSPGGLHYTRTSRTDILLSPRIKQTRGTKKKKKATQFEFLAAKQDFRYAFVAEWQRWGCPACCCEKGKQQCITCTLLSTKLTRFILFIFLKAFLGTSFHSILQLYQSLCIRAECTSRSERASLGCFMEVNGDVGSTIFVTEAWSHILYIVLK